MALTEKQLAFATNKAHGMKHRDAAIHAGYAPNAADVTAAKLIVRPDIKKAIAAAKKQQPQSSRGAEKGAEEVDSGPVLQDSYIDSLDFMRKAMNNPRLPAGVRFDAAKQLLPYEHGRIGEKGKKEKVKDQAGEVIGRGRFGPKDPPTLKAVK